MASDKRRRLGPMLAAGAITGSLLALAPGPAHAEGADVTTDRFQATDTVDFVDPCTGLSQTLTIAFMGTFHQVVRPTGTFMEVNNINGYATAVPGGSATRGDAVHFTSVQVGAAGTNVAFTDVLNAEGRAPDGTKVSVHALLHLTTNALDVTVVEFDKAVCP